MILEFARFLPLLVSAAICPWHQGRDAVIDDYPGLFGTVRPIARQALAEDLACLRRIFETQYIAARHYASVGVDLAGSATALADALPGALTQTEFLDRLIALHRPAYDAHLAYQFHLAGGGAEDRRLAIRQVYYADGTSLRGCRGLHAATDLTPAGPVTAFVGQFVPEQAPAEVACTTAKGRTVTVPLVRRPIEKLPASANAFHFEEVDGGILYVRVPKMTPGISDDQAKLLARLADTRDEPPLLFDLRGNRGGDDAFARRLGSVLRPRGESSPALEITDDESLLATASLANAHFLGWKRSPPGRDADAYRDRYLGLLRELDRQAAAGLTLSDVHAATRMKPGQSGERAARYASDIVLLVDKGCASSCESMIQQLRRLASVTILGADSGGYLHFGNVGTLRLPHSGILVFTGSRRFRSAVDAPEGEGFAPDAYILRGDSLATALAWLRSRYNPNSSSVSEKLGAKWRRK